ncbi:uncharacterized protein Z520_03580 [Fonsecaea multimorphosa CBS 102226]|uniref:SnoaL-like domain-containing protein n=1 Tax=Fonsecaea multimorphosa CBS 102226 TaxID=1442371 RepID=A0A0D2KW14_9EURO|nr:uncharacterized protein Z520_03580 [Fonsecaea multimorphosa CBS 102226]KIY00914.1 hypothetical protein Z520_03580 [Fonsecaea multimorphosa CBS 102226]OAL27739.1 hypothetical protein AYO22_03405 [Fonsecaea multimorphosa]
MTVKYEIAEIIRQKKSRYCRAIDTKQWNEIVKLAWTDADLTFYDPSGSVSTSGQTRLLFTSPQDFTKFLRQAFANAHTLHQVGEGDLEQVSADEVQAIWGMEDQIIVDVLPGLSISIRGGGYYHETWREKDGDWFLQSLKLRRTYWQPSFAAKVLLFLQRLLGL